jgi:hypothetical protein
MSEDVSTAVGSQVLFENDFVRVWEMVLAPGEEFPVHKHLHDHVLIYPEPGKIRGHIVGVDQVAVQEVDAGWVFFRAVGPDGIPPHWVENIGDESSRHFIIELLAPSVADAPRDPEHNGRGVFDYPDEDA